ncbi:MAG: signal peptidase II [Verrucomicrobia bacterium]|nr:signal peptidase II [Verrucomicrobiota bacterium]
MSSSSAPSSVAPGPAAPSLPRLLLTCSLPWYAIDQATKWLAHWNLVDHHREIIPGFFTLVYVTNTGAAFGLGKNSNTFFIFLACAAAVFLTWLARSGTFATAVQRWGFALLVPGLFGNLTDRLVHGAVIDFLSFHLGRNGPQWPAFNVADSCICVSVALFLWSSFKELKGESGAAALR